MRKSGLARSTRIVGTVLLLAVVVAAPLAVGGVHRVTMSVLMVALAAAVGALAVANAVRGESIGVGLPVILPLILLLIPVLQSIPIPLGVRAHLDPRGTDLLRENDFIAGRAWPLSLDPASTRVNIGRGAAALAVFLGAFHLAARRHRRRLILLTIAGSGVAAVVIGLGHRIFGFTSLYGVVAAPGRTLLTGPFVNSNHTSEFLELTAFACLACSFFRRTALNRVGWLVGAALCGAGALATISRGAVAALAGGALVFGVLRFASPEEGQASRHRTGWVWGLLLAGFAVLGAGALGADQLVERFRTGSIGGDIRFQLWRDGLRVLAAHPAGIGRGAFERVFPVYRTVKTPFALRFSFLENEPLQWLVDSGWVFFGLLAIGAGAVLWYLVRHARKDRVEAALLGGLIAVLVHSVFDFGLETLGVLLPFMAVLGVLFARLHAERPESSEQRANHGLAVAGVAVVGLLVGTLSLVHSSSDDLDQLLKRALPTEKRALLVRAQATHPLDYFYPLSFAALEPVKGTPGHPSPRMHALNRALRLCPSCETVHAEIASNLWWLGYRKQSLLEWRSAIDLQPVLLNPVLGKLFAAGGKPEELAAVAASDPERMVEVANFLSSMSRVADAFVVLDQADAMGTPPRDSLLVRGKLQLQAGQTAAAQKTIAAVRAAGVHDPRLSLLEAQTMLTAQGAAAADEALRLLDEATARYPNDLPLARERVDVVIAYQKWQAAGRAVEGFKQALYHAQGQMAEAHRINARIEARLGRWTAALGDFRIALAEDGRNVSLWVEYGLAAENAGRDGVAREAYREAARLSPNSPEVVAAIKRIDDRERKLHPSFQGSRGEP